MYDLVVMINFYYNKIFVFVLSFKGVIVVVVFVGCSNSIKIEI